MKTAFISVLAAFVLIISGCGDDASGPSDTWNNGDWTGSTASQIPVTFTLDHPDVSDWTITVTHEYAGNTVDKTWTSPALTVAADSSFSWSDSVYADSLQYSFSMSGTFASGDSVQGLWDSTLYYQISGSSGVDDQGGSWTASGP